MHLQWEWGGYCVFVLFFIFVENLLRQETMSGPTWFCSAVQAEWNVYNHPYPDTPPRDSGCMGDKKRCSGDRLTAFMKSDCTPQGETKCQDDENQTVYLIVLFCISAQILKVNNAEYNLVCCCLESTICMHPGLMCFPCLQGSDVMYYFKACHQLCSPLFLILPWLDVKYRQRNAYAKGDVLQIEIVPPC